MAELIAHRGNLKGPSKYENSPSYVLDAVKLGYKVEVDIWYCDGDWYLGHDYPRYLIDSDFISHISGVAFLHAKNLSALYAMLSIGGVSCFWHENDDYTLTSCGKIWTYPNKMITSNSIIVCQNKLDTEKYISSNAFGVCSDYIIS